MKQQPQKERITVEFNGERHTAEFYVASGVVIVEYGMITNSIVSHGAARAEASTALREILEGGKWRS